MTDTIQTPIDTPAGEATGAVEFLHLDPADIIIGSNVRTDLREIATGKVGIEMLRRVPT